MHQTYTGLHRASTQSWNSPKGFGSAELTAWHSHAGVGRLGLDFGVQVVLAPIALVDGWSTVGNASADGRLNFLQEQISATQTHLSVH